MKNKSGQGLHPQTAIGRNEDLELGTGDSHGADTSGRLHSQPSSNSLLPSFSSSALPPHSFKPPLKWRDMFRLQFLKFHLVYILVFLIIFFIFAFSTFRYTGRLYSKEQAVMPGPRGIIFMLADGFGATSHTLARELRHLRLPLEEKLKYGSTGCAPTALDDMRKSTVRTRSYDSLVTDSAAAATAYACGSKTRNHYVAIDEYRKPLATIVEAAKLQGIRTAITVTSTLTHATPASFIVHGSDRDDEDGLADAIVESDVNFGKPVVDVFLGGGYTFFLPRSHPQSDRSDDKDLIKAVREMGYQVIMERQELLAINSSTPLPLMGLFARAHIDYDIERNKEKYPSMAELMEKSLTLLESSITDPKGTGFFMLFEGSRIDMAAHENDPATHAYEAIAYMDAVQVAKDFVKRHPSVLLISLTDHETGGLSLGRRNYTHPLVYPSPYRYNPEALLNIKVSALSLSSKYLELYKQYRDEVGLRTIIHHDMVHEYHMKPLMSVPGHEYSTLDREVDDILRTVVVSSRTKSDSAFTRAPFNVARVIGATLSRRALVDWSTPGHSGSDIVMYSMGNSAHQLSPSMDNIEVHEFMRDFLNLDMEGATALLRQRLRAAK